MSKEKKDQPIPKETVDNMNKKMQSAGPGRFATEQELKDYKKKIKGQTSSK